MNESDRRAALVHHDEFKSYDFGPQHPLRPERIAAGLELLAASHMWDERAERLTPGPSSLEELETVHAPEYIRAVDEAGSNFLGRGELSRYGLTSADNPPFPDMHAASALVAGGTALAVRRVMNGEILHAFNPAGGLHHALRARASGFCIYNDPAIGCAVATEEYGARVLYIDLDAHHGDGVQWIFYDRPDVFTVSFHESGRFLFPGTGGLEERGEGAGRGYSLNLPFLPYTTDVVWQEALEAVLPAVVSGFRPDLIISNHGCDTHVWDPITHLSLTTRSLAAGAALIHRLAHDFAEGRWVAVGSGGYEWRMVVPRSWAILWAEMAGHSLPAELPAAWTEAWLAEPLQSGFLDDPDLVTPDEEIRGVERLNRRMISQARLEMAETHH